VALACAVHTVRRQDTYIAVQRPDQQDLSAQQQHRQRSGRRVTWGRGDHGAQVPRGRELATPVLWRLVAAGRSDVCRMTARQSAHNTKPCCHTGG
jgi:hypothetical protein